MEDQASSLQLDQIDNGLSSHNGNNMPTTEIAESIHSLKTVDGSNGTNLLDAASSTTTEIVPTAQPSTVDNTKKVQNASNGVEQASATESIDNHQDDDLIRELEQFEGDKNLSDEVGLSVPKLSTEPNGSNIQDTSELLKDLESDSPCPGPSEPENDTAPIESIVGGGAASGSDSLEVLENKKTDDVQVDSTTESSNKRKFSLDSFVESAPKRANNDNATETSSALDLLNTDTQKSNSEIDSDTESKLLQENSDGEVSMSDIVEAITSTSTVTTKTTTSNDVTSDIKLVDKPNPSHEDLVVSSSGNEDTAKVGSTKDDVKTAQVSASAEVNIQKSTESKGDDEVSSNKMNDTTEVMEQDFNETIEADRISENDKSTTIQNTSGTSANESNAKKSTVKSQLDSPTLGKASDTVVSSQPDTVDAEQCPMEIDTESKAQSDDATQKCNGLSSAATESKTTSETNTLPDSGKVDAIPEPVVERIFEICVSYEENELKSMTVERSAQKNAEKSTAAATSTPPTKHTANGVVELCNFMINHFTEMKKSLNVDDESTPKLTSQRGRGSAKKNATQTASPTQATPKSRKRSSTSKRAHDNIDTDESESKAKQAKNSSEKSADDEALDEVKGDCCLARWTDRKYYAGRVIEEKPGNKFAVLFEDGALKNLSAEVIVFGVGNILPLMDHAVHVLVADDTYEPGFVTKIETEDDEVMYTVEAESKTVKCAATKIYLMDDQAKAIHHAIKSKEVSMKTPDTPSSKRTGRLPAKLEETITTLSGGRSSRGKKSQPIVSPEPGFSGDIDTKKSGRRSNKRHPPPQVRVSESSDVTDPLDELPRVNSDTALEAISGVQPELQSTRNDSEIHKRNLIAEYLNDDPTRSLDGLLGPMPKQSNLFKGMYFMLTCTVPLTHRQKNQMNVEHFGSTPFYKAHLCSQIERGGGRVYRFFEEIPENQYRNCKLIAPYPCTTAKYVQSMAANIVPISHEWIMECCQKNQLLNIDDYILPSGWSLIEERYINWKVTRSKNSRKGVKAFKNVSVMIASVQEDFSTFWGRVCKLSGCETSVIKSLNDIKDTPKAFLLTDDDDDCVEEMKSKAEHCKIPVVSSVWVVQSLITGHPCDPESNPKLKMAYDDEDY